MLPCSTQLHRADDPLNHAIASGQSRLCFGAGPDGADVVFGEFGLAVQDTPSGKPSCVSVREVFSPSDVLQIAGAVVRLVAVNVIDFKPIRTRANEGSRNDDVNSERLADVVFGHPNELIAVPLSLQFQDFEWPDFRISVEATDTAVGAGFVESGPSRNRAPLFGRGTIQVHRDDLLRSRGATPGDGDNIARASCVNFTTPDQRRRAA